MRTWASIWRRSIISWEHPSPASLAVDLLVQLYHVHDGVRRWNSSSSIKTDHHLPFTSTEQTAFIYIGFSWSLSCPFNPRNRQQVEVYYVKRQVVSHPHTSVECVHYTITTTRLNSPQRRVNLLLIFIFLSHSVASQQTSNYVQVLYFFFSFS